VHDSRGATLALRDGKRGLIVKCFAGCLRAEVIAELRRLVLFAGWTSSYQSPDLDDPDDRIDQARKIWSATTSSSVIALYLAGRGYTGPIPSSLRFAPNLWHRDGSGPAMVARIVSVYDEFVGVHRTWVERVAPRVWQRRPVKKMMLGRAASGAVRLATAVAELPLLIAEGIETGLAGMMASGWPAWAALSAGGIEAVLLPGFVRDIIILADNDINGRGQEAAYTAAERWLAEGRKVRIAIPPIPGTDFADMAAAEARR
jgi:putative DNA primase/helicase